MGSRGGQSWMTVALPNTSEMAADTAELVACARAGEAGAFERLYRQHVDRVYALCLRLSADPVRAEELTQDVWVRVWEKLHTFRGESAFTSWLHRLTVNEVLGSRRSGARRGKHEIADDDPGRWSGPAPLSEPGVRMDLEAAIELLPPGSRTVFVLHDVEGYAHKEIAVMTDRAEGTSKALLHRARKLLREALDR